MLPITIETNCDTNHAEPWNQRIIYLNQPNIFLPQARIHILHGIGVLKVGSILWALHFFISGLLYFWLVIFNYNFESFQFFLNFPIVRFLCLNMNFKALHHCLHNLILINLILQLIDGVDKFKKLLNKLKHLFDVL